MSYFNRKLAMLRDWSILRYALGPKLYAEYGYGSTPKLYESGNLESFSNFVLSSLTLMGNMGYYASPLIVILLYRRGYFVADSLMTLVKLTTSLGIIIAASLYMRGLGRSQSRSYMKLIESLDAEKVDGRNSYRQFDFDFRFWKVDFDVHSVSGEGKAKHTTVAPRKIPFPTEPMAMIREFLAYIAIHTFGIRMIYPGSVQLLQLCLRPVLIQGRAKLIMVYAGQRNKIKTIDNNEIDTIFIDQRARGTEKGETLVICSEGNAGFYEEGITTTPISLNYSVLGWNHPGFEGSTGSPYPEQDRNAIDAVVQFAIHKLGFSLENIVLFGWSIGGFSTLSAATGFPEIKGIILDATFDDSIYLALQQMPDFLAEIVKIAIRHYCDLNNSALLEKYDGPVLIIRRTEDEIMSQQYRLETNRGNYLIISLLKRRYPLIFEDEQIKRIINLMAKPINQQKNNTDELCLARLVTYCSEYGRGFPMQIGEDYSTEDRTQMAEFLLRKHLRDFKSAHCVRLPNEMFGVPWEIPIEQGRMVGN